MNQADALNLALSVFVQGKAHPHRLALVFDDWTAYSYGQLSCAAGRVGAWLNARTRAWTSPRVGILAARSWEAYVGILGTCWAGGTYIPLNPKLPGARVRQIVERAGLDTLIVDENGAKHLAGLAGALPTNVLLAPGVNGPGTPWCDLGDENADPPAPLAVAPDHPAYVIFTSGTSGVPKGVVVSNANVAHFVACMRALYRLTPNDRVAQYFETSFDVSVGEMFSCWDGGAALHVIPETKVTAPAGFLQQHEITFWMSVPSAITVMQKLRQLKPNSFPKLRASCFGGEGVPIDSIRAFQEAAPNCVIDNQYGPTEATVCCIYQRINAALPILTPGRGTLSIGNPYPGMHAAILGEDKQFLGTDQTGELALSGPQVALGYFGDEHQTQARILTLDHPKLGRRRWYLTGDLAFRDSAGRLHCLGRVDNQVKVNGFRVELEEIEAHLRTICRTDEVAAVAWPVNGGGNASGIVAFVGGGSGAVQIKGGTDVRDMLRLRVPSYMVPSRVMPLEALPLSPNGKVDRRQLVALLDDEKR